MMSRSSAWTLKASSRLNVSHDMLLRLGTSITSFEDVFCQLDWFAPTLRSNSLGPRNTESGKLYIVVFVAVIRDNCHTSIYASRHIILGRHGSRAGISHV